MANSSASVLRSDLPAGVTLVSGPDIVVSYGRLRAKVALRFDPPASMPDDLILSIDGRMAFRSQGQPGQLPWVPSETPGTSISGNVRTLEVTFDTFYPGYCLSPGHHQFSVNVYRSSTSMNQGEIVWSFNLPYFPAPTQTPRPALVSGKIVRFLFWSSPSESRDYGLNPQSMKEAGANAVNVPTFINPADAIPSPDWNNPTAVASWQAAVLSETFTQWQARWLTFVTPYLDWCVTNGYYAVGVGDDFFRSVVKDSAGNLIGGERWWWVNSPWRNQAVEAVRDLLASPQYRDVIIGMEMTDEVEFILGGDPTNSGVDPWAFYSLWHQNPHATPICWPGQKPWVYNSPGIADYSMRFYWDGGRQELSTPTGDDGSRKTLAQHAANYLSMTETTLLPTPLSWPVGVQTTAFDCDYKQVKQHGTGDYSPEYGDKLLGAGPKDEHVGMLQWLALVMVPRASVLKCYAFDLISNRRNRQLQPAGSQFSVGVKPGTVRWKYLTAAWKSIAARESLLTSRTPLPATFNDCWAAGGVDGLYVFINLAPFGRNCPYISRGVLLTDHEEPFIGQDVPPGGVVLSV